MKAQMVHIRIPVDLLESVDEICGWQEYKPSRTAFILQAIRKEVEGHEGTR